MRNRKLPGDFERIDIDATPGTGKIEISQTTTTVSQKYQIYQSDDLINFEPDGASMSGDGGPISWLLERGRDLRKFFLIKPIGFDGEE
ncbi:MAG: hypothetical protein ACI9R3_003974 [Verrucomicrobiales bacterium]|jgi:hypothetical protein